MSQTLKNLIETGTEEEILKAQYLHHLISYGTDWGDESFISQAAIDEYRNMDEETKKDLHFLYNEAVCLYTENKLPDSRILTIETKQRPTRIPQAYPSTWELLLLNIYG